MCDEMFGKDSFRCDRFASWRCTWVQVCTTRCSNTRWLDQFGECTWSFSQNRIWGSYRDIPVSKRDFAFAPKDSSALVDPMHAPLIDDCMRKIELYQGHRIRVRRISSSMMIWNRATDPMLGAGQTKGSFWEPNQGTKTQKALTNRWTLVNNVMFFKKLYRYGVNKFKGRKKATYWKLKERWFHPIVR